MTVRDCYEACLIELNKVQAPSLLINDFVYLLNKNIQEYFNKKYNSFEKIQQNTDDLRYLIKQKTLENNGTDIYENTGSIYSRVWECKLPTDYVHILGCKAVFNVQTNKCQKCRTHIVGVNKLDTNQSPQIGTNWYMKPSYNRPYYQIINIEKDPTELEYVPDSKKVKDKRYGNSTQPIMQIICGDNIDKYILKAIEIQYLQAPKYVTIDQDDLNKFDDETQILEFSDYVCNEIVKQLVTSILENQKDQRLQTYIPVNQSIPQN